MSFLTCSLPQWDGWFATPQCSQASHNFYSLQYTILPILQLAMGQILMVTFCPLFIMYAAIATSCNQIHWSMKDKMWFVALVHWLKISVLHGLVHISLSFWSWNTKINMKCPRNSLHAVKASGRSENAAMQLPLQGDWCCLLVPCMQSTSKWQGSCSSC